MFYLIMAFLIYLLDLLKSCSSPHLSSTEEQLLAFLNENYQFHAASYFTPHFSRKDIRGSEDSFLKYTFEKQIRACLRLVSMSCRNHPFFVDLLCVSRSSRNLGYVKDMIKYLQRSKHRDKGFVYVLDNRTPQNASLRTIPHAQKLFSRTSFYKFFYCFQNRSAEIRTWRNFEDKEMLQDLKSRLQYIEINNTQTQNQARTRDDRSLVFYRYLPLRYKTVFPVISIERVISTRPFILLDIDLIVPPHISCVIVVSSSHILNEPWKVFSDEDVYGIRCGSDAKLEDAYVPLL